MIVKNFRQRAHLANGGEFNRRYLTCQISAILNTDRSDRRKSQSLHRAHLASFADRGISKCVASLSVPPVMESLKWLETEYETNKAKKKKKKKKKTHMNKKLE